MNSATIFIFLTQIASCMQLLLRTEQNDGLQYFETLGYMVDDMVPARLIVEISLEPGMKSVYKVEAFIRTKDSNSTPVARAIRASLNKDIQRAARRLRDTERLLFRVPALPQRPKRQFLGAAAMATAAYAVFDVHQLRGTMTDIAHNQDIITQRMDTVIDDVVHLAEAQATTTNVLGALDAEMSDMELMVQLTSLERTAADYCYQTAAAMDSILDQRLTTGLVSEEQLQLGFQRLKRKAWQQGLTPIMDDPKQAYQLTAYFEAKFGQPLRVWVDIPMTPVGGGHHYKLLHHKILPHRMMDETWLLERTPELIGISHKDGTLISLDTSDLHRCQRLGQTYLCNNVGTQGRVAGHSCTAAVYMQDMTSIRQNCRATQLTDKHYINRLNATSFVSYSPAPMTASITCRRGAQSVILYGLQVSHLKPGCTLEVAGTTIHSPVTAPTEVMAIERTMPKIDLIPRRRPHRLQEPVKVSKEHMDINSTTVGKEPVLDALDDVQEWINSVWRGFLGYGAAICSLVMLIFCMAWGFRRSARTPPTAPKDQIQITFNREQEEVTAQTEPQQTPAQVTPPPCRYPTVVATQIKTVPKTKTMEQDTIGQLLAKNAI